MNRVEIRDGALTAYAYPDYGGMLGRLIFHDIEILHLDENRLPEGAVLAGGNPVLFPFPSRTAHDLYELNGIRYRMPFHGLVRDSAFGVEEATPNRVTLLRTSCREWKRDCYPFDFTLRLAYALEDGALRLTVCLENHEDQPMPHAFGWHPYFVTTDKARACLIPNMARCERWDEAGKTAIPPADIDLNHTGDYVLCERTGDTAVIQSPADGYSARIRSDGAFQALIACTKFPGTTCVEPWMGLPNAANTRENLQWVAPRGEARYTCEIRPYLLT